MTLVILSFLVVPHIPPGGGIIIAVIFIFHLIIISLVISHFVHDQIPAKLISEC